MKISPLAGKPAPKDILINVDDLVEKYYRCFPCVENKNELVIFGTSGHRGSPLFNTFNEAHILAITQAICDYRKSHDIDGPLFIGKDTHLLSCAAQKTAIEVFAGNQVNILVQSADEVTPTPVISWTILNYNRGRQRGLSDGVVITPSHNPPCDGGFKYNPPDGGPADTSVTSWIQNRANEILKGKNSVVKKIPFERGMRVSTTQEEDFLRPYVDDLKNVVDMESIRSSKIKLGVDPLGGASERYWEPIWSEYKIDITVVNKVIDSTFSFMTVDYDGKIRMDCSSPYAMARLIGIKDQYRLAFGNDPDSDRHGIVTPSAGLMNPNHFLAVAIDYLLTHRQEWRNTSAIGKTVVSSAMIDRVVASRNRKLFEVPVGFKWFAKELFDGAICFGGEESAGASFLRKDGRVWTTDKDGIIMDLLAAEITAVTGLDPSEHYRKLTADFGNPIYTRIDSPASAEERVRLSNLTFDSVKENQLAGEPILEKLTHAPGNGAAIGGLKITTKSGWFAVRPSGTEDIYKIYAESFKDQSHLDVILNEAEQIVKRVFSGLGS
jgi:phosphoglucomutase